MRRALPSAALIAIAAVLLVAAVGGLGLAWRSLQRADEAERDVAALRLLDLERRTSRALLAEAAAVVLDDATGNGDHVEAAETLRAAEMERARLLARRLASRRDSIGDEARRWFMLTTGIVPLPGSPDRVAELIEASAIACCAAVDATETHHTARIRPFEELVELDVEVWVAFAHAADPPGPPHRGSAGAVLAEALGISDLVAPGALLPSERLRFGAVADLRRAGADPEALAELLSSTALATLDDAERSDVPPATPVDDLYSVYEAALAVSTALEAAAATTVDAALGELASEATTGRVLGYASAVGAAALLLGGIALLRILVRRQRLREAELVQQRRLMDARTAFLRTVSHEIRTPVTAISGFASTLSEDWEHLSEDDVREFLGLIDRQARHLAHLVDDLLTYSKLEAGNLRLRAEPTRLARIVADAADVVRARYDADVAIDVDPELVALADPDRVLQIVRNLVENAVKYGKADVHVEASGEGRHCVVAVSDAGPGIPPEEADRIFEFWQRVDPGTDDGFGLGLPIARSLARAMGGELRYVPRPGGGARFELTLPAATPAAVPEPAGRP